MKVTLLRATNDPDFICAVSAYMCRNKVEWNKDAFKRDHLINILRKCILNGHHSILEHASFTFYIEGISRVTSHQLVRHRIASYSQLSQRASKVDFKSFVYPPNITPKDYQLMYKTWKLIYCTYQMLLSGGMKKEDARYILPSACTTSIVVTMNARELRHFFEMRLFNENAQWEIKNLAKQMFYWVGNKYVIFEDQWKKYKEQ